MSEHIDASLDELVERARGLIRQGERRILAISGTPGAGKSTLCGALAAALGDAAVVVPMDGFHLANEELIRLGRRDRKGAPDTFDVDGYVALLRRLRGEYDRDIYAPRFDRALEESIGSAVVVPAATPLIITEGNYVLLDEGEWAQVRGTVDEGWYVDVTAELRAERLLARRQSFGDSAADAAAWIAQVDEPNAAVIESMKHNADLVINLTSVIN